MAGYDPQKSRGRREIPADEPAPVDGLLGPAPDEPERGPVLAHDAGRPMVRQVLPVPPRPAEDAEAHAQPEPVEPAVEPEVVIDLDAGTEDVTTVPADEVAASAAAPVSAPAQPAPPAPAPAASTTSRARVAAVVAAIVALVVVVLWRRRHRR